MGRDFDTVLLSNPNGVAVIHIIATGFNLWFLNTVPSQNAVGMGHMFGLDYTKI
ncbi:hypothetical protein [Rhodohalobacter barkolensis]|uniref:hypothetical protein n=1 Tax=Rhodohalobacter barkolensis TaxID=2053187 RepID=UPI0013FD1D20|nr:hypothetical protein [Rhodohalobacter barkolensis]